MQSINKLKSQTSDYSKVNLMISDKIICTISVNYLNSKTGYKNIIKYYRKQ